MYDVDCEQLKLELLKLRIAEVKIDLYKQLLNEVSVSGEPIFEVEWLKKNLLNSENMFKL
jgi:hypothetical protein